MAGSLDPERIGPCWASITTVVYVFSTAEVLTTLDSWSVIGSWLFASFCMLHTLALCVVSKLIGLMVAVGLILPNAYVESMLSGCYLHM